MQQPSLLGTTAGTSCIGLPPKHDADQRGTAREADAASGGDAGEAYDKHPAADRRSRTPAGPGVLGGRAKALHSLQKQEAESLKIGKNRASALQNGLFSPGGRVKTRWTLKTKIEKLKKARTAALRTAMRFRVKKFKEIHVCCVQGLDGLNV